MVSWLRPVAFTTSFICMDLTLELTPRLRYLPLRYLSSSRNNNEHRIYCRRRLCVKRPDYCGSEAESSGVVKPRHGHENVFLYSLCAVFGRARLFRDAVELSGLLRIAHAEH